MSDEQSRAHLGWGQGIWILRQGILGHFVPLWGIFGANVLFKTIFFLRAGMYPSSPLDEWLTMRVQQYVKQGAGRRKRTAWKFQSFFLGGHYMNFPKEKQIGKLFSKCITHQINKYLLCNCWSYRYAIDRFKNLLRPLFCTCYHKFQASIEEMFGFPSYVDWRY